MVGAKISMKWVRNNQRNLLSGLCIGCRCRAFACGCQGQLKTAFCRVSVFGVPYLHNPRTLFLPIDESQWLDEVSRCPVWRPPGRSLLFLEAGLLALSPLLVLPLSRWALVLALALLLSLDSACLLPRRVRTPAMACRSSFSSCSP